MARTISRAFQRPAPSIVDGHKEYEVRSVLDVRASSDGERLEYLVLWKGYPASEATWEAEEHLKNSPLVLEKFWKDKGQLDAYQRYDKILKSVHTSPASK